MSPSVFTPFLGADESVLLDAIPNALVLSDQDGRILLANSHAARLFGYSREELLGKDLEVLIPGRFEYGDSEAQPRGSTSPPTDGALDLQGRCKDGTIVPLRVSVGCVEMNGRIFVWNAIEDVCTTEQHRLDLAMDAGGVGTFDWNVRTGELIWDQHQERLFGFEPGEFDGTFATVEKRVHPDDRAGLRRAVRIARTSHATYAHELRVIWPDGSIHWILGRGEFLYDERGRAVRMCGAAVNLDERKTAERALQQAEERFRYVMDNMLEGCKLIDFNWTLLYVNEAAASHFLKRREEVIGRSLFDAHPGLVDSEAFPYLRRCMEDRKAQHLQETVLRPDGTARWYEVSVIPVPEGIFVLSLDVTDRTRAEKDLRESEERLRQAVRVSGIGIFDHDHASDFVYWSPEEYEIYGWSPDIRVTVQKYIESVHPDDRERIAAAVRSAHDPAGDGSFDVEHRLVRPDGTVHWTSIRSQTFFEGEGEGRHPVRTVGAATDVTDRKQAEEDKAKLEGRLYQAQKMESIGRLAGGVAHDFNNLLTVINGYTDLLLNQKGASEKTRVPLQEIKKAGLKAAELTQQLLAFGREQKTMPKVLNLNRVIRDQENLLRRLIGEDIRLETALSPDLGPVRADPGQILQVLMNLAANGRDAMPHGGSLRIETANIDLDDRYALEYAEAVPGPYVLLSVSDTGLGMDAETRGHIFEPFFTTKRVGKGTGLGLATVYGVVKNAGGFIRVQSEPEKGATFFIYLHRVEGAADVEEAKRCLLGNARGTETVLLVEDQPELRELVRTTLQNCGYTVLEAANADEALQRSAGWAGEIHLMLTDVVMPGMSGWDLASRLKAQGSQMKVIYMSGYSPTATPREIQDAGIDYLQKPMSPDDLLCKVREVLDRRLP